MFLHSKLPITRNLIYFFVPVIQYNAFNLIKYVFLIQMTGQLMCVTLRELHTIGHIGSFNLCQLFENQVVKVRKKVGIP